MGVERGRGKAPNESQDPDSTETAGDSNGRSSGLTIRIPRAALIIALLLVLAGGGVAAYFALRDTETCVSRDTGNEVGCEDDAALSQAEYDEVQAQEAKAQEAEEKAQAKADKCESQMGDLLADVRELNSRLAVGLPYDDYSRQVGSIRVSYDQVPFSQLDLDCTSGVGLPLEDALNNYVKAGNTWGDCIEDFNCDVDSIDPELQSKWTAAEGNLQDATSGLRDMGKP
jgi:hypothetical protein